MSNHVKKNDDTTSPSTLHYTTLTKLVRGLEHAVQIMLDLIYYSDHTTLGTKLKNTQDIRPSSYRSNLTGVRIGIPWRLSELKYLHDAKLEVFEDVLKPLQCAGAALVHDVEIAGAAEHEALSSFEKQIILDTDMKVAINDYLSTLSTSPKDVRCLQHLIEFTKSCPE